jgi:hypothetical protein
MYQHISVQRGQNHKEGRGIRLRSQATVAQCRSHSVTSKRSVPTRLRLTVSVRFAELKTLSNLCSHCSLFPKLSRHRIRLMVRWCSALRFLGVSGVILERPGFRLAGKSHYPIGQILYTGVQLHAPRRCKAESWGFRGNPGPRLMITVAKDQYFKAHCRPRFLLLIAKPFVQYHLSNNNDSYHDSHYG